MRDKVIAHTDKIFTDAVCKVFNIDPNDRADVDAAVYMIRNYNLTNALIHNDLDDKWDKFLIKREKVSEMYQEGIKNLETKKLNEILKAHQLECGVVRTPKTIETIISELARRAIFSDFTDNDGDVDGPTTESKNDSSKAISKRHKSSKSR